MVVDKNGVSILKGSTVLIHQEDEIREAVVIEPFPDNKTSLYEGHWVDIKIINDNVSYAGVEGMMSYILEVIDDGRRNNNTKL